MKNEEKDIDEFWSEGEYIKPLDENDLNIQEKMKYFDEANDSPKEHNCKKCNVQIGKHNLYWHEGFCNKCFFKIYFPDNDEKSGIN